MTHHVVYVVGFVPNIEDSVGTGGFNWFPEESEAKKCMIDHMRDPYYGWDYMLRAVPVPFNPDTERDTITDWLNDREELWSVPSTPFLPVN